MDAVRRLRGDLGVAVQRLAGEEGQGLVEYGLILLLVAIGVVGAVGGFGFGLAARYGAIVASMPNV